MRFMINPSNVLPDSLLFVEVFGMISNYLLTDCEHDGDMIAELCQMMQELFQNNYEQYIVSKLHELLFHLPHCHFVIWESSIGFNIWVRNIVSIFAPQFRFPRIDHEKFRANRVFEICGQHIHERRSQN
ncbi:unnamed protein product [Caenorhabditis angaria]|uniref:Uncharacterized protein n=1 Tax=Caenorhabditis angaria TaxID=860376 RepID=A0A9P1MTA4_9PELO|nr:unnamed protein product [Caenorhabditis angaria]